MSKFSLKLKSEVVTIETKDGTEEDYEIVEMSGEGLEEYFNGARDKIIMDNGKVVGMKDFTGLYTSLLRITLKGPDGKFVPLTQLKAWPASVQKGLFEIAQKLNGLDKDSVEEAKND